MLDYLDLNILQKKNEIGSLTLSKKMSPELGDRERDRQTDKEREREMEGRRKRKKEEKDPHNFYYSNLDSLVHLVHFQTKRD